MITKKMITQKKKEKKIKKITVKKTDDIEITTLKIKIKKLCFR